VAGAEVAGSERIEGLSVGPEHPDTMTIRSATATDRIDFDPLVAMSWLTPHRRQHVGCSCLV
jgi:hypothetical protein